MSGRRLHSGLSSLTGQNTSDPFTDLDWKTLEKWAGARAIARGRKYQREKRVRELARGTGGALVAWVEGTERYATAVISDSMISSICTCPVGSGCKHAVAVILEYLALRKENKPVGTLPAGDLRLSLLGISRELIPEAVPAGPAQTDDSSHAHKRSRKGPGSDRRYLEGLTQEELIGLLLDLVREFPMVEQEIRDRKSIATADSGPVLDALISDINRITAADAWSNSWNGESQIPDYSPVRRRMEILLSMGFPDAVVRAGRVLMKKGAVQVEQSDDEGETAEEIASCMELVFQALARSSLPAHERMLFAILADLHDDYDLCTGAEEFWREEFPGRDWDLVAENLISRLDEKQYDPDENNPGSRYARDRLVNWIVTAWDNAGRGDEATDLCIAEAGRTDSYVRLVRRLIRLGQFSEAAVWIVRGVAGTEGRFPGIGVELRTIQRELWEKEGEWLRVAGMRAEEFLDNPSFLTYSRLKEATRAAGEWDSVERSVRQYLESGTFLGEKSIGPRGTARLFGILPTSDLFPLESKRKLASPFYGILIDIAISEKRPDEVLTWYDKGRKVSKARGSFYYSDDKVADCIADDFPDRALAIWMEKAEKYVAESRPKSYEASVGYLEKIGDLMKKQGRDEEWDRYIAQIRSTNARKRKFLEMLDVFEGKKI